MSWMIWRLSRSWLARSAPRWRASSRWPGPQASRRATSAMAKKPMQVMPTVKKSTVSRPTAGAKMFSSSTGHRGVGRVEQHHPPLAHQPGAGQGDEDQDRDAAAVAAAAPMITSEQVTSTSTWIVTRRAGRAGARIGKPSASTAAT
jgi:hypothetical protein